MSIQQFNNRIKLYSSQYLHYIQGMGGCLRSKGEREVVSGEGGVGRLTMGLHTRYVDAIRTKCLKRKITIAEARLTGFAVQFLPR